VLFGAHVSISGGISTAIDRGEELGCDAVQVFTQSPQMWKPTVRTPEELEQFRARREASGVRSVVCHALYLVNLASADREIRKKSVTALRASLETADAIGAEGVMFHVGSHLGKGLGGALRRIVPQLRELLALTTDDLWLLLENSAGAGGTIGRSIDELAVIAEKLDHHPRIGICLDSCHWWASGVDITDADALDGALADVESRMGPGRIRCLHINDAAVALGSNRDRHASLGEGTIGEGMATFLAHPLLQDVPAILETRGPDGTYVGELALLKELHRKGRRRRPKAWR
jgi:deoxyribonuclease-4